MPKQKIEIEVDVPDHLVLTGVAVVDKPIIVHSDGGLDKPRAILAHVTLSIRKKFVWPAWLKAAAIARDKSGYWWAYDSHPAIGDGMWVTGSMLASIGWMLDIDLPDLPWDKSLIVNPNRSEAPERHNG